MDGRATAPAAGTVLNALATGFGSAFAIDVTTTATVELHGDSGGAVTGEIAGDPDADARLVERCVELVTTRYGDGEGGHVRTESDVPVAAGLKSSSAAANATVAATLSALDWDLVDDPTPDGPGQDGPAPDGPAPDADDRAAPDSADRPAGSEGDDRQRTVDRKVAACIGVEAARDVGVTVTGAFDDASASMLGGLTVTDNRADELLAHRTVEWDVLVWLPPERAFSADADVERCERIAPLADLARDLALDGEYATAMTVNGFGFCAALDFPTEPLLEALPDADGASLSGTGPGVVAVGERPALERVREAWDRREGETWFTTTRTTGTRTT